jgi:signal transduction histidine kinase
VNSPEQPPAPPENRRSPRRLRLPRYTVRLRLTILYGCVFLVSGTALLAITFVLVRYATHGSLTTVQRVVARSGAGKVEVKSSVVGTGGRIDAPGGPGNPTIAPNTPLQLRQALIRLGQAQAQANRLGTLAVNVHGSDLHQLLIRSGVALAIMAVASMAFGWLLAGRALRPLRTMTAATRQISEENLHHRLALGGPRDELKELGDTIDGLLGRLQDAFDAQRRFVANASHELRTPLTVTRALLEMVIEDPDATVESFRAICRQALEEGGQQEQLIDALLVLARSQRGLAHRERLDLASIAGEVLRAQEAAAAAHGLRLDTALSPAPFRGNRHLVERLVSNLLENAVRHNVPNGHVQVVVESSAGQATLRVTNTGPPVPADQIERLLKPFQRHATERAGEPDGLGLGLSIVNAIATAHGATLIVDPQPAGGLRAEVRFPNR